MNHQPDEWERLRRALAWLYGESRMALIIQGKDAAAKADIAKWRKLGKR